MIAREEAHYRVRIGLHDLNESNDDSDRGSPVHGLCNEERIFGVRKFLSVVPFMGVGDHEYLPIAGNKWIKTSACLTQELSAPTIVQNCFGRSSPAIRTVRSLSRTPSPPASSTAHKCRGIGGVRTEIFDKRILLPLLRSFSWYRNHQQGARSQGASNIARQVRLRVG